MGADQSTPLPPAVPPRRGGLRGLGCGLFLYGAGFVFLLSLTHPEMRKYDVPVWLAPYIPPGVPLVLGAILFCFRRTRRWGLGLLAAGAIGLLLLGACWLTMR